jgi:Na+/H+ antiporter NhaD/arsenite permease-like protein
MTALTVAVFALTYVLIASQRLAALPIGRAAGALLGAVLMVATRALTPDEALAAVDGYTLALLFALMGLSAYLERSGLFGRLGRALLASCRTPRALLLVVALVPGLLSAFLLNDAICLFLAPIVIDVASRGRVPMGPYLIALATSANIGSAATLVGNPQNVIIGSLSGYAFAPFLLAVGPAAATGLALNAALLFVYYGRALPEAFAEREEAAPTFAPAGRPALTAATTLAVVAGFFAGFDLAFTALGGVMVLVLAERREPDEVFAKIDWSLLVFFAALFIVVAGLSHTGLVDAAWEDLRRYVALDDPAGLSILAAALAIGSNVVSNVPVVLLAGPHLAELGSPERAWALLAFVTTVAGNLTLVGSVANLIVAERAKAHHRLGFFEHLRFGLVSTCAVTAAGVPLIVWATGR